ncbi:hypothetical protein ACIGW0_22160 [Streptomyces bikiniensis]|uniref:Uncharacterized protein n=1 Tax=Streptomyces bikiniensis TaxID=1896 RepID=A0ABW8CWX6_STRBI
MRQETAVHLGEDRPVDRRLRQRDGAREPGGAEAPYRRDEDAGVPGRLLDETPYDLRRRGRGAQVVQEGPRPVRAEAPEPYGLRSRHVGRPVVAGGRHEPAGPAAARRPLPPPPRGERGARMGVPEVQVVQADQDRKVPEEPGHGGGEAVLAPRGPQRPARLRSAGREGGEQGPRAAPRHPVAGCGDPVSRAGEVVGRPGEQGGTALAGASGDEQDPAVSGGVRQTCHRGEFGRAVVQPGAGGGDVGRSAHADQVTDPYATGRREASGSGRRPRPGSPVL